MFQRHMSKELWDASQQYPVVTVTGPRQSGKTTLVKEVFPDKPYANLESISTRGLAEIDPVGFLDQFPQGAILDEIQRCPQLLSEIQVRVDQTKTAGMFILTGSHQVELQQTISQSLAGRTALLHLLPLGMGELQQAGFSLDVDTLLFQGGYPRIYQDSLDPSKAYDHYVQTYLERDLRQMIEVKNLQLFRKFLFLCAGRIGQLFNKSNLANEVGVSSQTIGHWISILEASYIIFLLPPYFENFNKRITKSPKLYFCDVGLASFLLGIEQPAHMASNPLRGNLFENLIILELIKTRWNKGRQHKIYFFQDSNHNEVDVIFHQGNLLTPIEIKSSKTFHASFLKGIQSFQKIAKDRCVNPSVIYAGSAEQTIHNIHLRSFIHSDQALTS